MSLLRVLQRSKLADVIRKLQLRLWVINVNSVRWPTVCGTVGQWKVNVWMTSGSCRGRHVQLKKVAVDWNSWRHHTGEWLSAVA